MKKMAFLVFCSIVLFTTCKDRKTEDKLADAEKKLVETNALLEATQQQLTALNAPKKELMHLVFFQLKKGYSANDIKELLALAESLNAVKSANQVQVGVPIDTNDPRAKTNYQVALMVAFDDVEKLATYQQDLFHAEVRKKAGPYLAGPPVVYDFMIE